MIRKPICALSQKCPCCCLWNKSSVVWLTMDVKWVSFFLSNGLTNSEEIKFSRSSSLFCPALDAINFSCRKNKNVIHSAKEDKNNLEAGASYDAAETSQLLISSVLWGLALVKSGLKGTEATMQAHTVTGKPQKCANIFAFMPALFWNSRTEAARQKTAAHTAALSRLSNTDF